MTIKPKRPPQSLPPVNCRSCELGRRTIYGATADSQPDAINTRRREVCSFAAGRTILREGEKPAYVYTLYSGWAYSYSTLRDGRRQIYIIHVPGDILALESLIFPDIFLPFTVKSLTPAALCAFVPEDAAALIRNDREQIERATETMQTFLADNYRRMAALGRRTALGRLAQFLAEIERRLRWRQLLQDGSFDFPVRQEHLADALGLTTVYVNRTLDKLRKLGVIDFDRQTMTIRDPKGLREIGEEE